MAYSTYIPSKARSRARSFLRIEDLDEVLEVLRKYHYSGVNSYQLGLSLGLLPRTLDPIKARSNHGSNVSNCLLECIKEWLQQADNVKSKGGPTWYVLIKALRSLGENTVADGIDKEKHPACLILSNYQSESVMNVLPQLGQLLYKEGLLPNTSQELMSRVQEAVCADHHNLVKFASVLRKLESTISMGDAILTEYREVFIDNSQEIVSFKTSQEGEEGAVVRIPLTLNSEFAGIRAKYAHMFYEVKKAMTTPPSAVCIEDLKSYLRSGYPHLKPQLLQCKTISDVIEVISDESSLISINILEGVVDNFDNKQAKSVITTYTQDVAKFCESIVNVLNEQLSSLPILLCETATFLVDGSVKDWEFQDIKILVKIALKNKAKVVVIKEGNSFSITCSFPLTLSHTLITNALQNIEQLKERGVYQLTIGYCTVYKRDLTEVEEGIVQQSTISSVYTCKGGMEQPGALEQLMVAQSIQLIEREEEITSLNKDMKQLTKMNKFYEEKITLLNKQVSANSQFNILKRDNDDGIAASDAKKFSEEKENETSTQTSSYITIDSHSPIKSVIKELHDYFSSLLNDVQHTLDISIHDDTDLFRRIDLYCKEYCRIPTLLPSTNIFDLFNQLRPYYDFLNCELIEAIVRRFLEGPELHIKLIQYIEKLEEFLCSPTLEDLKTALQTALIPLQEGTDTTCRVVIKLTGRWGNILFNVFQQVVEYIIGKELFTHIRIELG